MKQHEIGQLGEEFVNNIAYNTFLKYWCYPGPKDELGDKKEICDLLILFNKVAIIISVKNYQFKGNYARYFRNTTEKALIQIWGAERKLFGNKPISIKHPDRIAEIFDNNKYDDVYRIIVNLGEGLKFYSPSYYTKADKHVTIMERESWENIVQELDTISDLISYLKSRELLFKKRHVLMLPKEEHDFDEESAKQFFEFVSSQTIAFGDFMLISGTENDLLALYILNGYDYPKGFKKDEYAGMFIQIDGEWAKFIKRPEVIEKKKKDKDSYFIDDLVRNEILNFPDAEIIAIKLMELSRFERRILAKSFFEFHFKYTTDPRRPFLARGYRSTNLYGVIFIFYSSAFNQDKLQTIFSLALDSYAVYSKYEYKELIVIGANSTMGQFKLGYSKYMEPFTKSYELEIMNEAKKLGWFTKLQFGTITESEY